MKQELKGDLHGCAGCPYCGIFHSECCQLRVPGQKKEADPKAVTAIDVDPTKLAQAVLGLS